MKIDFNKDTKELVIKLDVNADATPSKSGKTMILETTSGPQTVNVKGLPAMKLNINLYRGLTAKEQAELGVSNGGNSSSGFSFG